jgi:rhodanese-related sulfurtransferase
MRLAINRQPRISEEIMSAETIKRMVFIILVGLGLGVINKFVNPKAPGFIGYYPVISATDTAKVPEAADEGDPPYISIGEAADFFNTPGVLFIDARDEWDYNAGHIRGAVNLPFETDDETILEDFLANTPKDQPLVVYCNGADCDLSLYLGRTLAAEGFVGVNIFFGGWSDWQLQNLPSGQSSKTKSGDENSDSQDGGGGN